MKHELLRLWADSTAYNALKAQENKYSFPSPQVKRAQLDQITFCGYLKIFSALRLDTRVAKRPEK